MISKILGGVGRVLIGAGTLILLFVAYQLWGTNIQAAKAQDSLRGEFAQTLETAPTTAPTTTADPAVPDTGPVDLVPVATAPADLPLPAYGDPIAKLKIPKIGVESTVVEGVGLDQLKRGPGHYQETPLPGQKGNSAIAGHRTTYGAPFHNVDKLEVGDQMEIQTVQGTFVYVIDTKKIVKPNEVEVLADKGDNRLTLTACHPKYSLRERIVISGVLKGQPAPDLAGQAEARTKAASLAGEGDGSRTAIDGNLSGIPESKTPAIVWGLICVAIALATWGASKLLDAKVGKRRKNRWLLTWSPYLIGTPVFLVALYVFFENFAVLLPANF